MSCTAQERADLRCRMSISVAGCHPDGDLARCHIKEVARKLAQEAPPLTDQQVERLSAIFHSAELRRRQQP